MTEIETTPGWFDQWLNQVSFIEDTNNQWKSDLINMASPKLSNVNPERLFYMLMIPMITYKLTNRTLILASSTNQSNLAEIKEENNACTIKVILNSAEYSEHHLDLPKNDKTASIYLKSDQNNQRNLLQVVLQLIYCQNVANRVFPDDILNLFHQRICEFWQIIYHLEPNQRINTIKMYYHHDSGHKANVQEIYNMISTENQVPQHPKWLQRPTQNHALNWFQRLIKWFYMKPWIYVEQLIQKMQNDEHNETRLQEMSSSWMVLYMIVVGLIIAQKWKFDDQCIIVDDQVTFEWQTLNPPNWCESSSTIHISLQNNIFNVSNIENVSWPENLKTIDPRGLWRLVIDLQHLQPHEYSRSTINENNIRPYLKSLLYYVSQIWTHIKSKINKNKSKYMDFSLFDVESNPESDINDGDLDINHKINGLFEVPDYVDVDSLLDPINSSLKCVVKLWPLYGALETKFKPLTNPLKYMTSITPVKTPERHYQLGLHCDQSSKFTQNLIQELTSQLRLTSCHLLIRADAIVVEPSTHKITLEYPGVGGAVEMYDVSTWSGDKFLHFCQSGQVQFYYTQYLYQTPTLWKAAYYVLRHPWIISSGLMLIFLSALGVHPTSQKKIAATFQSVKFNLLHSQSTNPHSPESLAPRDTTLVV
jgi:hypothetical protein